MMEFLLKKKIFVLLALVIIIFAGLWSYRKLKIDVFPDPSPVMVQVLTEAEGMAPEEVEKFVSHIIENGLYGLPDIEKITSLSTYGLSIVNVYFQDRVNIYFARQLVSQKLAELQQQLPPWASAPKLGPITTGLGMVYVYCLEGKRSLLELRTLQDWLVRYELLAVPGVAAVMSHGGYIKQYLVRVDPDKLLKYGITLHQLMERIRSGSKNVTAGFIQRGREELIIRGIGLYSGIEELKKVVVKEEGSTPIFLEQVAEVEVGRAIRRGAALKDGRGEVVAGIVMKLIGVNTAELIERITSRIKEIERALPPDVHIVPVYNQALLVKAAFRTVAEALLIGIVLVSLILFIFINDLPSAAVATLSIPFSVLATFIFMERTGMTADLMSFGGLAIGIGLLVDATVVVVENIARHRESMREDDARIISLSLKQIIRPLSYAMLIIILSFLPILTLTGVEGKLFRPFASALLAALISALLFAVIFAPVLMHTLGRRELRVLSGLFPWLRNLYLKAFDFFYSRKTLTLSLFGFIFLVSVIILSGMGSEFIPRLNEQTPQLEVLLPQNTSLEETIRVMDRVEKLVMEEPEVKSVFTRIGRGEAGTHPHPVNMGNSIIILKDRSQWRRKSVEKIVEALREKLTENIPGASFSFTQPIKHNIDELISGVRADLAVKIFGQDYYTLWNLAVRVSEVLSGVEGATDIQISRLLGQREVRIVLNRGKLARYGLDPAYVMETVETAIGGKVVAKVYEGDRFFDVFVRFSPEYRGDVEKIRNLLLITEKGYRIPLNMVADINESTGLNNILRENGKRYITVQCNVVGRDIGSFVDEARKKVEQEVELPEGYWIKWGGQFELKKKAERRLSFVLLLTLSLILLFLADYLKSWRSLAVMFINLPLSLSGGLLALWLSGEYLSVPSSIGFIALLGIGIENCLVLISFFRSMERELPPDQAIRRSVELRLRPILMTKFTTIIGLLPLVFSRGIGAEVQRPLAVVVVGGIFFSIFTTLFFFPVLYRLVAGKE